MDRLLVEKSKFYKTVEQFKKEGYRVLKHFVDEYSLMYNDKTSKKVRVYTDGAVLGPYE